MQTAARAGPADGLLIELIGARRVLEIGCFTGYGTLAMALALPPDGRVLTLDVNDTGPASAAAPGARPGSRPRSRPASGRARKPRPAARGGRGRKLRSDLIDADKKSYDDYYERAWRSSRPGGLILIDNVLWGGPVADPANHDRQTETLRALNAKLHDDRRISLALVPIGDGLTVALEAPARLSRGGPAAARRQQVTQSARASSISPASRCLSTAPGITSSPITKAGVPSMPSFRASARLAWSCFDRRVVHVLASRSVSRPTCSASAMMPSSERSRLPISARWNGSSGPARGPPAPPAPRLPKPRRGSGTP